MGSELPVVPNLRYMQLNNKPWACPIAYTCSELLPGQVDTVVKIHLIFINGLGLPQTFWQPVIEQLRQSAGTSEINFDSNSIYTTTYDRYGQGLSRGKGDSVLRKHDLKDSVEDMREIIDTARHDIPQGPRTRILPIIVAHSIGVPQTRLYLKAHPGHIEGAIFLDSNMANVDMISLLPDPDSSDFTEDLLPADTTVEQLRWTRANYQKMFSPDAPNAEYLDRSNIPALLPDTNQPRIHPEPFPLTVVSHDPDAFAEESLKISTKGLTRAYIEPAWHKYNLGLLQLGVSVDDGPQEIIAAKGSGHFVQRDNPSCIAEVIWRMIARVIQPYQSWPAESDLEASPCGSPVSLNINPVSPRSTTPPSEPSGPPRQ